MIAFELARELGNFGESRGFGRAVMETLFHLPLPLDRNRRPDAAYVSFNRWPVTKVVPSTNAWDVLPEIVAEVISPSELVDEIFDKIEEYFRSGVDLVWAVYPKHRLVYVYESFTKVRILTHNDTLDGGLVLPGFQLPLSKLFVAEP